MNSEQMWIANGIRLNESGRLVIDAETCYGNRKRWEGEMEFHLPPGQLDELVKQVEELKATERMIEVATCEMKEFLELFKADYHEKKRVVAEQLNLDVKDIPTPYWNTIEDQTCPVEF